MYWFVASQDIMNAKAIRKKNVNTMHHKKKQYLCPSRCVDISILVFNIIFSFYGVLYEAEANEKIPLDYPKSFGAMYI